MDFLLWAVRSVHIFSVVVWLGGLMYQGVVTIPVARAGQARQNDGGEEVLDARTLHMLHRFMPFVWMSVWTILVTGIGLMLFNPGFVFGEYRDSWSVLLGLKQVSFALMVFFSFGYARMLRRCIQSSGDAGAYCRQMVRFGRITVAMGIVALLLAAGLH